MPPGLRHESFRVREQTGYALFIEALGELASAVAFMSDEEPAAVPVAAESVGMPASVALVDGAALSLMVEPVVADEVVLSIGIPGCACVVLSVGLVDVPMVEEPGMFASGWLGLICAFTTPGTIIAAAARRSILRMIITPTVLVI